MKCMHCQGQMKKDTAPFHIDRQAYHLTVSDTKKSHKTDQNRVTLSPHKCRRKCDEQATI